MSIGPPGGVAVGWADITWADAYHQADGLVHEAKAAGKSQLVTGLLLGAGDQQ